MDSFEEMIIGFFKEGKIDVDQLDMFERELFGHFLKFDGREYHPKCLPIRPMLARPVAHLESIRKHLKSFGNEVLCEYKYDGERIIVGEKLYRCIGMAKALFFILEQVRILPINTVGQFLQY